MKSVEHWKQVKASELQPFDVVMMPQDITFPAWSPSGRRIRRTETKYVRAMVTSNYLNKQSPYAILYYTGDTRSITTYTRLDCNRMVWKFVESRVSGKLKNELDKILASNNGRPLSDYLYRPDSLAWLRTSVESSTLKNLREFLGLGPTLRDHIHKGNV